VVGLVWRSVLPLVVEVWNQQQERNGKKQ